MLLPPFRASSCGPIFQYRLFYLLEFILSKNFEIIRCYSEVMTSPFYLVKLESFTLKVCQLELKKGCQPKLLFERFGAISNIVRRKDRQTYMLKYLRRLCRFIEQNIFFPETCFAYPISEQKFMV